MPSLILLKMYHNGSCVPSYISLTHWNRSNIAAIFRTTFLNAFSCMEMHVFRFRYQWSLSLANNIPTLAQTMAWRQPGDKPLSEPMMVNLLAYLCVTRSQWVDIFQLVYHPIELGHDPNPFRRQSRKRSEPDVHFANMIIAIFLLHANCP